MACRNEDEQQIRAAAECMLGSSSSHHFLRSHDSSLNTVLSDVIPPGDVVTGLRPGGRMSVVRRFFCLFVTFDLLFTILMWLICIMLISADVFKMMSEQIVHYNIHTSLFDIVMAAAARFVILLLFYGVLYINHWSIIALSTAGTCSFLIAKVFLYSWLTANSPVLQVLLIITSFVISWGEAWFLDFRVIPQEVLAKDIVRVQSRLPHERSPLLQPYLQGCGVRQDDVPESVRNFYSPMDSLAGSDDEGETNLRGGCAISNRSQQGSWTVNAVAAAREAVQAAWSSLLSRDWHLEKETPDGDKVESRTRVEKGGKVYRLQAEVKLPSERLLQLLFNEIDTTPNWNPTLTLAKRLEVIDDQTDVSYQVMAAAGSGLVSSRDFVTLRRWERRGGSIILASVSTNHMAAPDNRKPIRAEQGPSCWVLEQGSSAEHTHLRWLLDTDLKGWIPQTLLDQAFATAMLQWVMYLRKHAELLRPRSWESFPQSSSSFQTGCV